MSHTRQGKQAEVVLKGMMASRHRRAPLITFVDSFRRSYSFNYRNRVLFHRHFLSTHSLIGSLEREMG